MTGYIGDGTRPPSCVSRMVYYTDSARVLGEAARLRAAVSFLTEWVGLRLLWTTVNARKLGLR